jgi:hypothetical protein
VESVSWPIIPGEESVSWPIITGVESVSWPIIPREGSPIRVKPFS